MASIRAFKLAVSLAVDRLLYACRLLQVALSVVMLMELYTRGDSWL